MSDLIVLAFKGEKTAYEVREKLVELSKQHLITLEDLVVVVRNHEGKVKIKQSIDLAGAGALSGSFWGMLIGLLFWMPLLGLLIGAISGAIGGALSDVGINDDFIKKVGKTVGKGDSAVFMLVREATMDRVEEALSSYNPSVISTNLSADAEEKLRESFKGQEIPSVEVHEEEENAE